MGRMLDTTLSWIFEKMAKAYVHRTGNSLSDAKVPVVQEVDGKPYFNLSSIGSADLAKLSGANGIDGTIAEAISGLRWTVGLSSTNYVGRAFIQLYKAHDETKHLQLVVQFEDDSYKTIDLAEFQS